VRASSSCCAVSLFPSKPIFPKILVKSLLIPILFITFALVILRIAGDESLARIQGLAYFLRKAFITFSSDSSKIRDFRI